ncbi:DUF4142 domain-containing protein [Streptosporangium sp. G11]|uniref:DUF4142 domain-containing protein n=1 Tax=Streptosporangium sp. G11 TaxID=3436926 RepID=UPI003EBF0EB9
MVHKMIVMLAIVTAAMDGPADISTARGTVGTSAARGTVSTSVPPAPQPLSRQDRDFLVRAHQGSLFEIEAGMIVNRKTDDQDGREAGRAVRVLGAKLVADHTKLAKTIRQVADQLRVKLPNELSAAQRERLEEVVALRGAEFDRAWINMEIVNHREGVALVKRQIESGSAPMVKKLALVTERVVRGHLDMFLHAGKILAPDPSRS